MKTFLSIGTGPGLGFAVAERFCKEGFQVVLTARDLVKTQSLAERLTSAGYRAEGRSVDSADPRGLAELIAAVQNQHGSIEVLHYNAASLRKATLFEQPRDSFNSDLGVNIGGALVAAQAVASKMEEQQSGAILLTGGGFALAPNPDYLSISIGKAGIRALAHALFEPFREKGIHIATVTVCTLVDPGTKEASAVAEHFWQLYSQPKDSWTAEASFVPARE
ncbi:SDR family NAD(P)-dependent oxidoreductase [Bradyrhizobium liaoningense]|uniref:SDR family NAD(P)-dependent oxidoreductase n=1 Tax=Bradyrhizobium liaoningense TaxID=43992 RepID=UPI001BA76478|nr:SDR family NAD(P)-dependent oxidoreductase [Bradyrhizobium liaoningense]MBR1167499.1 SDR family NAD(P)-dependent oxidoreductase [Bradyrhizobium liaoningense]